MEPITSTDWQTLADEAALAETHGRLTEKQLAILYQHRLFNLFVPSSHGGLGMSLPEAVRLQNRLAYIDGSVGWTTTLCAGAAWFIGFLDPALSLHLFANSKVCFGGSGMATGTADLQTDGSYIIQGDWKFATGAPHLTVFTANCQVTKGGKPLLNADGHPVIRSFCMLPDEVEVIPDWDTMGLKATASHSFRTTDLRLAADRSFLITVSGTKREELIYRFPFDQFAELTLAANYKGMIERFFDLYQEQTPATTIDPFAGLAVTFDVLLDQSWEQLQRTGDLSLALREDIHRTTRNMVRTGIRAVSDIYPETGIRGATLGSPLNRVWRDLFTASQHIIFR